MSTPEIVGLTRLNAGGTRISLAALTRSTLVEAFGTARSTSYRLNSLHPLAAPLIALFAAEAARVGRVLDAIRAAAMTCPECPMAVWLYGSVARGDDGPLSDIDVAIVEIDDSSVARNVQIMRETLAATEAQENVTISLLGLSQKDIVRLSGGDPWWKSTRVDAILLFGASPDQVAEAIAPENRKRRAAKTKTK